MNSDRELCESELVRVWRFFTGIRKRRADSELKVNYAGNLSSVRGGKERRGALDESGSNFKVN